MSRQWAKVSADTISHPDGSSKSPLYVDGITLDKEATASTRTLSINTTSGELQSNDQGTTRPLMARAAAVSHLTMDGVTTAFSAGVETTVTLSWPAYTHKITDPGDRTESSYEDGPVLFNLYATFDTTPTYFYVSDGMDTSVLTPDSSNVVAYNWVYQCPFNWARGATSVKVKSDVDGDVRIKSTYVGCHDGQCRPFS